MKRSLADIRAHAHTALLRHGHGTTADFSASACAFLEGVGYPGLKILVDALTDTTSSLPVTQDALGLDLQGVSCVFIGVDVAALARLHGRLFLRNVRHGLYLLPDSVSGNYGIGCPVDPGFALGGERTKNPYAEKLALAEANGVEVDTALWTSLM